MEGEQSTEIMVSPTAKQIVDELIKVNKVMVFSKSSCPYCTMAKNVLKDVGEQYGLLELDQTENGAAIQTYLSELTGGRTVPRVFIKGEFIGGYTDINSLYQSGKLTTMLA